MKIALKQKIHFLDTSSVLGLSTIRKLYGPGEYDVDIVDSPHSSFDGEWIMIRGTVWGVSKKFLEQWKHLGDKSPVQFVNDCRKEYVGSAVKRNSNSKS